MAFLYPVTQQIKSYFDKDGSPLNGTLRFGVANQDPETTSVTVFWDVAGTQPAAQPITVRNGYAIRGGTPANVFADGDFSSVVRDSRSQLVYTVPNSSDIQLALSVTGLGTASAVGITDAGGYYTSSNVEGALQEVGASLVTAAANLAAQFPTGSVIAYCGTTAPSGFVLESGRTIGSAGSGATERANADTSALYTLLWNSSTNTELVIQDSAGTPTTRGASAANDYAANKRLPLPDGRGRTVAGKDNMGGSTASRITNAGAGIVGTTQFAAGGFETYALTIAQLAAHTHVQDAHTHTQNSHTHTDSGHTHTATQPPHTHNQNLGAIQQHQVGGGVNNARDTSSATIVGNTGTSSDDTVTVQSSNAVIVAATATNQNTTATNQNTGSTTAHQNTQPTIMYTRIIKL